VNAAKLEPILPRARSVASPESYAYAYPSSRPPRATMVSGCIEEAAAQASSEMQVFTLRATTETD
jgi:hypothetical protein